MIIFLFSLDPYKLMRDIQNTFISKGTYMIFTVKVSTKDFYKTMRAEIYAKGKDSLLIRILSPKRDSGISFLKLKDRLWAYFPNIRMVIRIPPSLMGESWMGSHFTYDDLVKETELTENYILNVIYLRNDTVLISAKAKKGKASIWDSLRYRILISKKLPISAIFYEKDKVKRIITFGGFRKVSGRWIPMFMEIKPPNSNEYTRIIYNKVLLNVKIPDTLFSPEYMQR